MTHSFLTYPLVLIFFFHVFTNFFPWFAFRFTPRDACSCTSVLVARRLHRAKFSCEIRHSSSVSSVWPTTWRRGSRIHAGNPTCTQSHHVCLLLSAYPKLLAYQEGGDASSLFDTHFTQFITPVLDSQCIAFNQRCVASVMPTCRLVQRRNVDDG